MNFITGFLIYHLLAFAFLMTQLWSVSEEQLQEFIDQKNEEEGTHRTKGQIYVVTFILAWFLLPLMLFAPRK